MNNPFAQLVGFTLRVGRRGSGASSAALDVRPELLNPNGVVHGGVMFSMADTVMGAALFTTLEPGEYCATVEIKIHFLEPVVKGKIRCLTRLVHRGRRIAVLESHVSVGAKQVAQALGTFTIFTPRAAEPKIPVGNKRPRLSK